MSLPIGKLPQFLKQLVEKSSDALMEAFEKTAKEITDDMREIGKPVAYPVQWDSEKQRKAFFATDGFGSGIPYQRKGDYENSWKKTQLPNGWEVSAKHPAGAIGGTLKGASSLIAQGGQSFTSWQSKIHRGRWRSFLTTATQRVSEMPKDIIKRLKQKAGSLD